ncbi:hypothetical protein [Streptomyces sp. NPDC049879]|uniref:hypothetical protein n=1 Tax=Streptomyces sp. NPDC049879 TaxID=3365598 RepID=UPI0037915596
MTLERRFSFLGDRNSLRSLSDGCWAPIEEWLGESLPGEYKDLVAGYGDGVIAGHLYIPHPSGSRGLLHFMQEERKAFQESYEPLKRWINPRALEVWETVVPWAYHDWNGDTCFLLPPAPERGEEVWNVGIAFRQCPDLEIFDGGVENFLEMVIKKGEYPRGWPRGRPVWMPVDDPRLTEPPEGERR